MKPEIQYTPFELWQLEKYNNIIDSPIPPDTHEDGFEASERYKEWCEGQVYQQMLRDERYYSSIKE